MSKAGSASKITLHSFDDLFGNNEVLEEGMASSDIKEIPLEELHEFKNHPFKINNDKLEEMVESIRERGVLVPGICRIRPEGGYEIIAGHTRRKASELAGLSTMPMVVKNLNDDDAVIVMVDTNIQREDILPSEKAKAFSMRYEAMKHQGVKGNSLNTLSEESGESAKQIQRYIYIARLNDKLLSMVDDKKLPLRQAVNLSFLPVEEQEIVLDVMERINVIPSMDQSEEIKAQSQAGSLTDLVIIGILAPLVAKPKKRKIIIKSEQINNYFPEDYTDDDIENIIYELLEEWKNKR